MSMAEKIDGLFGFLERANLGGHLREAERFCEDYGAVDVQEILEDVAICGELADHLQLKRLERRRFDSAVHEVRAAPEDDVAVCPAVGVDVSVRRDVSQQDTTISGQRPILGRGGGGARRDHGGHGRGCGNISARPSSSGATQPSVNPFFERRAEEKAIETVRQTSHYFGSAGEVTASPAKHYYNCADEGRATRGADASCNFRNIDHVPLGSSHFYPQSPSGESSQGVASRVASSGNGGGKGRGDGSRRDVGGYYFENVETPPGRTSPAEAQRASAHRGGEVSASSGQQGAPEMEDAGHYFQVGSDDGDGGDARRNGGSVGSQPTKARNVGRFIRGIDGDLWGRVVADAGRTWKLESGRSAKKGTQGMKWNWDDEVTSSGGCAPSVEPRVPAHQPAYCSEPKLLSESTPKHSVLDALSERRRQEEETRATKREERRLKRRQQSGVVADTPEKPVERRVDPEDGEAYTLQELKHLSRDAFTDDEIEKYWTEVCRPLRNSASSSNAVTQGGEGPSRDGNRARDRRGHCGAGDSRQHEHGEVSSQRDYSSGSRDHAEERRVDPDGGFTYTYPECWPA
eukprot:TRINITY_DN12773_c0_g1_i2.p1 TRINITY_DN12773_c0_g1~~TRINITY_DN12773_c0_g1_i2.p1  ORF type:complete len:574 (-),score=80.93 TRINITY_DN12773_c0_g1_i2:190-1911(-)